MAKLEELITLKPLLDTLQLTKISDEEYSELTLLVEDTYVETVEKPSSTSDTAET